MLEQNTKKTEKSSQLQQKIESAAWDFMYVTEMDVSFEDKITRTKTLLGRWDKELKAAAYEAALEDLKASELADFRMDELDAVMHSVDKWLEGDDLKNNPATRAADAREIALKAIESVRGIGPSSPCHFCKCSSYFTPGASIAREPCYACVRSDNYKNFVFAGRSGLEK